MDVESLRILDFHEYQIKRWCEYYNHTFRGKIVTLKTGKYKGRKAHIDGVIPSHKYGFIFCCMVLKKDGTILNSDWETRAYRPREEFELSP